MIKQALVWLLAFAVGFVGLTFGLAVAFWIIVTITALAIFIPILSARRKIVQPVEEQ